jgi:2,3-diketo-5-methylthio-1-phosphopentane phosphatase
MRTKKPPDYAKVLITDFDGTMSRHDFYKLAIEFLVPDDTPDYWAQFRAGVITHFEALRSYFASIRKTEEQVLAVVQKMELDPDVRAAVDALRKAGWHVIIASAGCDWYIRRLLASAGVDVEVHSNPGRFEEGRGLLMQMPIGSPYFSMTHGIDKSAIVRRYVDASADEDGGNPATSGHRSALSNRARRVAYAGDGIPDADPARLVPGDFRFARSDLADVLNREHLEFRPFEAWSEIADRLLRNRT